MNIKKTLLTVFLVIVGMVVLAGGIFGVYYLSGGFEEEVIAIRSLYFENAENPNDTTIKDVELRTLNDFETKIAFLPKEANRKKLSVNVSGSASALDNFPTEITAGEPFQVRLAKDAYGNNVGGAVKIKFTDQSGQAVCYLKIAIDVVSTDNSIFFTNIQGNASVGSDGITQLVMSKSGDKSSVVFKSSLGNALNMYSGFTFNNTSLNNQVKDITFDKKYVDIDGNNVDIEDWEEEMSTKTSQGSIITTYTFKFVPSATGTITIKAKMHRTYEIQEVFESSGFIDFVEVYALRPETLSSTAYENMVESYNVFINKYLSFFNQSVKGERFFAGLPRDLATGDIKFDKGDPNALNSILESLDYVYVSSEIQISVVSIQLTDMSVRNQAVRYKVFDNMTYDIETLKDATIDKGFGVNIDIDNESIDDYDNEINRLFNKITMNSYVFSQATDIQDPKAIPVYFELDENNSPKGVPIIYDRATSSGEPHGYLVPSDKYISISEHVSAGGDKSWTVSANMPILNDEDGTPMAQNYIVFETTSINVDNGEPIIKNAIAEVFVEYTEYSGTIFVNELKDMAINNELSDTDKYALKTQEVGINTDSLANKNMVEYTKTLYFVERKSNIDEDSGNAKVLTSGYVTSGNDTAEVYEKYAGGSVYHFVDIATGKPLTSDSEGLNTLEGLRILDAVDTGKPTLVAINASPKNVNVFAVVVMTDKDGNPIDRDGNVLTLFDNSIKDPNNGADMLNCTLTVVASTYHYFDDDKASSAIKSYSINVTAFMDNVKFYTTSADDISFTDEEGEPYLTVGAGNYYERNFSSSYGNDIKLFKKLKLLVGHPFTLYISNHTLDNVGEVATVDEVLSPISYIDVNGDIQTISGVKENTRQNKTIAFEKIDWSKYNTQYKLDIHQNVRVTAQLAEGLPHLVQFTLDPIDVVASGNSGTNDGIDMTISLANDTIPYCNTVEGRVRYSVQTFDITKVNLSLGAGFSYYTQLYARYTNYQHLVNAAKDDAKGDENKEKELLAQYSKILIDFMFKQTAGSESLYDVNAFFKNNNVAQFEIVTDLYNAVEGTLEMSKIDMSQLNVSDIQEYIEEYTNQLNYGADFVVADEVVFSGAPIFSEYDAESGKHYINMSGALDLRDKETTVKFEVLGNDSIGYYIQDEYGMIYNLEKEGETYMFEPNQTTYAAVDGYAFILGNRYLITETVDSDNNIRTKTVRINTSPYTITVNEGAYSDYVDTNDVVTDHYTEKSADVKNKIINFKKGEHDGKRVFVVYKLGFGLTTTSDFERYLYKLLVYDLYQTDVTVVLRNPNDDIDISTNADGSQYATILSNTSGNAYQVGQNTRALDIIFEGAGDTEMIMLLDTDTVVTETVRRDIDDDGDEDILTVVKGTLLNTYSNYFSHLTLEIDAADTSMRFAENGAYTNQLVRRPTSDQTYNVDTINFSSSFTNKTTLLNIYLNGEEAKGAFYITIQPDLKIDINETPDGMTYEGSDDQYIYVSMDYDTSTSNSNKKPFANFFNTGSTTTNLFTITTASKSDDDNLLNGTLSLQSSNGETLGYDSEAVEVTDRLSDKSFTIKQNYLIYTGSGAQLEDLRKNFDIYIYCIDGDDANAKTICYDRILRVFINPTYTIDVTALSDNSNNLKDIYAGDDLYEMYELDGDNMRQYYISVYNGMSINRADRISNSDFNKLFDIYVDTSHKETSDPNYSQKMLKLGQNSPTVALANSQVCFYTDAQDTASPQITLPEDVVLTLRLDYKLNQNASQSSANRPYTASINLYVNLVGMEMYVSPNGDFTNTNHTYDGADSTISISDTYENIIDIETSFNNSLMTINITDGEMLDIDKYLKIFSIVTDMDENGDKEKIVGDSLRIGLDNTATATGMTIDISTTDGENDSQYYRYATCNLTDVDVAASIDIDIYVLAHNYTGDYSYYTLYKIGTIVINVNPIV